MNIAEQKLEEGEQSPSVLRKVEFIHGLNAPREQFVENIRENMQRGLPTLCTRKAMLVAGGPSVVDHLDDIREHHRNGYSLFAVNGSHDWLRKQGIDPNYCVLLESGAVVNTFVRNPRRGCKYLLASQCSPLIVNRLVALEHDVTLFHVQLDRAANDQIVLADNDATILAPAQTVGLHALSIIYLMGHKSLRVYGMDSSHRGEVDHCYDNSQQTHSETREFVFEGKSYIATGTWAAQADAFARYWPIYFRMGMRIEVIGDGLLPDMARFVQREFFAQLTKQQHPEKT